MIESETDQASVVFLGRKSFRMQVVGAPDIATSAGAIPSGPWGDTPTERIIERRRSSRVPRPVPEWEEAASESESPAPARAIAKSTIVGFCLTTFACGVLFATAVDRLRPRPERITQVAPAAAPPTSAPAAPIVQQLPQPEPQPLPSLAALAAASAGPSATDAQPAATAPTVKGTPAPRARLAATPRPRRPSATTSTTSTKAGATEPQLPTERSATEPPAVKPPAVKPPTPGKWVDPFAE